MRRREFLIEGLRGGSVLLVLPAGLALAGCGGGGTSTAAAVTPVDPPPDGLRFTSDTTGGHTHDFVISMEDFLNPPAGGITGETTVALGHSHAVGLTMGELAEVEAKQAVSKSTSVVDGHQHTFKFSLATAAPAS
jgi:hypothetical protein